MDNLIAKIKSNYLLFILLWISAIFIFAYAWVPGGLDVDSCNYGVVAKEILRTHKWLKLYDPVYGGVFYYHFPLCIWVTAGLFKIVGISSFSAKLFSMFCGIFLVGALFYFGKLLKNQWVGFFAGISLLFTNHIVRLARQCRMDIPVSLFITLAIFSFILAKRRSRLYYLLFGLFTFLAIFTKDVSGLAPLAIVFIYLAIRLKWKEFFHPLFLLGLLIALGPVFIWIWLDGNTLFSSWLNCNFLHLLKSPGFKVPWYYYIRAIITKYFYFLPFTIYGGYLAVKEVVKNKRYEFYLLIIWALFFPVAFSFGRQKIHYFILPMYPAAALLVGMAFDKIFKEPVKLKIVASLKYILIAASIIILSFPLNIRSKRFIETVRITPFLDEVLRKQAEYEFFVYHQDLSAILFYSQELVRAKSIADQGSLEKLLTQDEAKPRFFYLSEEDFLTLSPQIRENPRIILKYKDKIIMVNQKNFSPVIRLPDQF
jgi:4-amino-4-deoxy-L-arabinose transferase-like glycosyltransferase